MTLVRPSYLDDPVLRLIPSEPPPGFIVLPPRVQAWRGRFFLMAWVMSGNEQYAWALALAADPNGESQKAIATVADEAIVDAVRLAGELNTGTEEPQP